MGRGDMKVGRVDDIIIGVGRGRGLRSFFLGFF